MNGIVRQRACTFRYRVIEVIHASETEFEDETVVTAFAGSGNTREFKTLKAAQQYRDRLSKTSRWPVMLQVGVMQWLNEEEAGQWAEQHQGDCWE